LIQQSLPAARFLVVGRNPSRKVRRLQEIGGVEVTGSVADIRTYLAQARVSVAPFSIAAGIQNKILEAMAYGLPVVATPRAVQGLTRAAAAGVEVADTPEETAAAIVRLLRNPGMARERGKQSRRLIAGEYN